MLTGKAKIYFEKWLEEKDGFLFSKDDQDDRLVEIDDLHKHLLNGYMTEWFDSVGIYILPMIEYDFEDPDLVYFTCKIIPERSQVIILSDFHSRLLAIEDGFKKANKIYNER